MGEKELKTPILFKESSSIHQEALEQIIALTERIITTDGRIQTIIPFLSISRSSRQTPPIPSVLSPSFCLILQGTKKIHFGQDIIYAHAGEYLASLIDLPASAQIDGATQEFPYIGLRVDFTTKEIAAVIIEAEISVNTKDKKLNIGAFIGKSDTELLDLFIRLFKLTDKPHEVCFLSALIKR
ncbi:MAG: AraC family transcriptional regulator, partial [Gorillibacterium sp.]|nr:AraC family transcriptional regulator [Gorillibacterium sp.]